jgi:hypothetical protein
MNCTNVISLYLNIAINTQIKAIVIDGIAAISVHNGTRDLKIEYHIQNQIITIVNCLKLNHNNIGSSFSICTGILYCISKLELRTSFLNYL